MTHRLINTPTSLTDALLRRHFGGHLVTRIDHNGKMFTDQVRKRKVISIIQTATHRIRGVVFHDSDARLKDDLNSPERFIAVADAEVLADSGQVAQRVPFIAVNKAHIVWVIPANETERGA